MQSASVMNDTIDLDQWTEFVRDLRAAADADPDVLDAVSDAMVRELEADLRWLGRPAQVEALDSPKDTTLILAGRGYGKSMVGSHWITEQVRQGYRHIALVGETASDVRDTMIEGPSGIRAQSPPGMRPHYEPSKRRLTWPNGAVATAFAAESYDQLRGPNHDCAWVDELAKFRYDTETYDQLQFTLRLNELPPKTLITTTPRPTKLIRELLADPDVHVIRGSTYENRANLAPAFLAKMRRKYEGTRLGRQELHAEVLDDVVGALWTWNTVNAARTPAAALPGVTAPVGTPQWRKQITEALGIWRIVVAVDPAVSSNPDSDLTGIVAVGVTRDLTRAVVLDDRTGLYTPAEWAKTVKQTADDWQADLVVAERNQGGALVESNLRTVDRNLRIKTIHASRGKALRAEPVAGLYEQQKIAHLAYAAPKGHPHYEPGDASQSEVLAGLEAQMTEWVPGTGKSPDVVDAAVYALTETMLPEQPTGRGRADLI